MTASDPSRTPAMAERPAREAAQPDPWGVKRAENLLASLQGVLSARVVVSPIGEVTEVHVLTNADVMPKQTVRNVESALLAHLGLKVDHRKISVAQTADVKPIEALERSAVRDESLRRGIVFRAVEVERHHGRRVSIAVTLTHAGDEMMGQHECADTPKARLQAAGRATVTALDQLVPDATLDLEGVRIVEAFDATFALAGVHVVEGRSGQLLTGTCEVADSAEQAAVLSVLDATNRWLQSRRAN